MPPSSKLVGILEYIIGGDSRNYNTDRWQIYFTKVGNFISDAPHIDVRKSAPNLRYIYSYKIKNISVDT